MLQQLKAPQISQKKIKIIAHRGSSFYFPQNTKQAILAGLHSADLVQFDIMFTKDKQIIVFHDRGLSRLTDIASHSQFKSRISQQFIENQKKKQKNWWIRDFSYQQLTKLKVKQPVLHRPQLSQNFKISKLKQIIDVCLKIKNKECHRNVLKSGLLIQIKSQIVNQTTKNDYEMCDKLIQILNQYKLNSIENCLQNNLPIIIQSFNIQLLNYISKKCTNQIIQLYKKQIKITQKLLSQNKTHNTIGIGITQQNLLDETRYISKNVPQLCNKLSYQLFYWTIRDDDQDKIPFKCKKYDDFYRMLKDIGVTGFITQFPDKCKGVLGRQSVKYTADVEQVAEKCLRKQPSYKHQNSKTQNNPQKIQNN